MLDQDLPPEEGDEKKTSETTSPVKPGSRRLEEEARTLRRKIRESPRMPERRPVSGLWKVIYFLVILSVLGVSFLLLNSSAARETVARQIASTWFGAYPSGEQVFELPSPPPRSVEPEVQMAGPQGGVRYTDEGFQGVLYQDDDGITAGAEGEESEMGEREFVPPAMTRETEEALSLLRAQSEPMGALLEGNLEGFEYKEWTPLQNNPPRYMIDLVAVRSDSNEEVHLVWEVNLEAETVRPMSQAARDLVR